MFKNNKITNKITSRIIKIFYISIFIFVILLPNTSRAIVNVAPKDPARSNLVGWWTFDGKDISSGRMLDLSGNGNSLFAKNISTSTFYAPGIIGQSIKCDGVDDNLLLTSDPIGTGQVTISMWINPKSFASSGLGTMIWGNTTRFRINSENGKRLQFTSDSFTTSAFSDTNSIPLNKWSHVVVTRDATNQVNFYINGSLSGTPDQTSGTPSGSTVGSICESSSSANRFDGLIDDIKIYNTVLSSSSIIKLYDQGISKNNVTPKLSLKSGLVSWWTFDGKDMVNGQVSDISGNNKNANLVNISTSTFYISGKLGQGLNFDGIDDYISAGNVSSSINTVSFWIKTRNTTKKIMDLNGNESIESIVGTISANSFTSPTIYINGVVASTITANTWYHVVITTNTPVNASAVEIGRIGSSYFQGILDDVRFYNRSLSINEVKQLYNEGNTKVQSTVANESLKSGLLGWWTFDGKNMTNGRVLELSGNNNSAYLNSISTSTFFVPGKIGQGFNFDGVNDFMSTQTSITIPASNTFSFSFWIRDNGLSSGATISIGNNVFCHRNGTAFNCTVDGNSSGSATTPINFFDRKWHHVVYVVNGNNQSIYKDGVAGTPATETVTSPSGTVRFGNRPASGSFFLGVLDDIRVYNRVLSTTEIMELYNMGK
jgi:hypothetical protein